MSHMESIVADTDKRRFFSLQTPVDYVIVVLGKVRE